MEKGVADWVLPFPLGASRRPDAGAGRDGARGARGGNYIITGYGTSVSM